MNLTLHDTAPLKTHPYFTFLSVKLLAPNAQGLAGNTDHTNLTGLVERIESLAPNDQIYAGRKMGAGAIDAVIKQAMASFPDYAYQIGSRDDPNWESTQAFCTPRTMLLTSSETPACAKRCIKRGMICRNPAP